MEKVLDASIVAVAFIIITIVLFIARKIWPSLGLDIATIVGIVGAIATVVAIIVDILTSPELASLPTPAVTLPSEVPTATSELFTSTPTFTPDPRAATCQRGTSPFFDDFETRTIDRSMWEVVKGEYVSVRDGHLYFDVPLNDSEGWVSHKLVDAQLADPSISRIIFTFELDIPAGNDAGFLFLATYCSPHYEQVWVKAGGQEGIPYAALVLPGGEVGDRIYFEPLARDVPHTIDLRWEEDHVQVYIDGQPQGGTIPCEGPTRYAHFGADLPPRTRFVGYLDDICIWP